MQKEMFDAKNISSPLDWDWPACRRSSRKVKFTAVREEARCLLGTVDSRSLTSRKSDQLRELGQLVLAPLGGDRRQLAGSVRSHQIVERVAIWPSSVQVEAETGEAETSGPGQELDVPGGSHPLEFVDKRVVLQFARYFARLESVGPVGATLEERHHQDETLGHQRVL